MHPSLVDIGAYLRTTTSEGLVQGYPPSLLPAGTTQSSGFTVVGAKSGVLTVATGQATGTPTTQKATVSLESAPPGVSPTWVAVADSSVVLEGDEKSGRVNVDMTRLPSGHTQVRVKVVVELTGGTTPKQNVAATVVLGGFSTLPA